MRLCCNSLKCPDRPAEAAAEPSSSMALDGREMRRGDFKTWLV
jgi:hypothetical protein